MRRHTVVISPSFYPYAKSWLARNHFTERWDCDWYEEDMWAEHNGPFPKTWHFGNKDLADEFAQQFCHPYGYVDWPIEDEAPDVHQNKVVLYDQYGNEIGYMGDRYNDNLSGKEVAVKIRSDIKTAKRDGTLPAIRTSVASRLTTYTWRITITLYVDAAEFHLHEETANKLRHMAARYNHVRAGHDRFFIDVRPDYSAYA